MAGQGKSVLEVDIELQAIESKSRGRRGGKPKPADLERMIRGARTSPDPLGALDDVRAIMGYPEGWTKQMAALMGIEGRG